MRVTEVTDIEEVTDDKGALQYVEYLVVVFDRDPKDPPAAKVIGTEKLRISPTLTQLRVTKVDPATRAETDSYLRAKSADIEPLIDEAKVNLRSRVDSAEKARKWRAERLSN